MKNEDRSLAIIFDLDGVLVDTVEAHFLGWSAVARNLGVLFSRRDNDSLRGVSRRDALAWLAGNQWPLPPKQEKFLLNLKASIYRRELSEQDARISIAGVTRLLKELKCLQFLVGVASASRHASLLLEKAGIADAVDVVSDGHFAGKVKPHPDQLLHVARQLERSPDCCVVIEDSTVGLEAARRAGMRCIAIGTAAITIDMVTRLPSLENVSATTLLRILDPEAKSNTPLQSISFLRPSKDLSTR
ncbi:MAG TPA: HAD-IA family hydrolase [Chthoniobacterales bacterium]|nr:HAD-IA family hydrolase [Chthoniobacterales bacterium]